MLTQEQVAKLFDYADGKLYRRVNSGPARAGSEAGFLHATGYYRVKINSRPYLVHRVIFLHQRGYLPQFIDHVDGNSRNNRIENLREATKSENQGNRKINANNSSGIKNINWNKSYGKWEVRVAKKGKSIFFGRYKSIEDACAIADQARKQIHGAFARSV